MTSPTQYQPRPLENIFAELLPQLPFIPLELIYTFTPRCQLLVQNCRPLFLCFSLPTPNCECEPMIFKVGKDNYVTGKCFVCHIFV